MEPPPRALAPMVFDPASGKIVLFGGDRLDQLYADTWLYDTKTRTWAEAKPARSPSPRFGHALQCPKWPDNRQGGGWSTVALDTDRSQILHMGGGHSSYFGNDMAHYDILNGRWSIACRPQFAIEYNHDLNGPGLWAFNGAPWGNHNYQAYEYDPTIQRVIYIKGDKTMFYDPVRRIWPFEEKFGDLPFVPSKYVNYLCATPSGVICWTPTRESQSRFGLWRIEGGKKWVPLKTSGEPLPNTVCDGSTVTYDSKRDVVWGVLCSLRGKGALNALRVDKATLNARALAEAK